MVRRPYLRNYDCPDAFLTDVAGFAESFLRPIAEDIDAADCLPPRLVERVSRRRLFGLETLEDHGPALPYRERYRLVLAAVREIARVSGALAHIVLDQNLGPVGMLRNFAPDLARHHMPQVQCGQAQVAFLMTEPRTRNGGDSVPCTARPAPGGFLLAGDKDWVAGADERDLYVVVARSRHHPDQVGLFFVDRRDPASEKTITVSDRKNPLGLRGLGNFSVHFDGVFIPHEHVLLAPHPRALGAIMRHHGLQRCGQSAIAIGLACASVRCAFEHLGRGPARNGHRTRPPRSDLAFAEMCTRIQAADQLNRWAVDEILSGSRDGPVASSMAKLFATETAVQITTETIGLCGEAGVSRDLPLERFMRDARMLTIAGGTSDSLRANVARWTRKTFTPSRS